MSNRSCVSDSQLTQNSSRRSKKTQIVALVNELLEKCSPPKYPQPAELIPKTIKSLKQLQPHFYVYFYENICGSEVIDKKWPSTSSEDHVHNTQAVIDSLSLDVLHEDLSYLTGEAICKPHLTSIEYLLDLFKSVHEWIESQRASDRIILGTSSNTQQALRNLTTNQEKNDIQKAGDDQLNQKINESLRLTETILEEIHSKKGLANETKAAVPDNDVFRSYMRQKELEYEEKKRKSEKSSSGNSSLSNVDEQDELIRLVNDESRRQVKFQAENQSPTEPLEPLIETIGNELDQIRQSLNANFRVNSGLNAWMRKVYEQDLEIAQDMKTSELEKASATSEVTNRRLLDAIGAITEGPPKASLKIRPSSRIKGVLLPRSRSLVDYSRYKREDSRSNISSSQQELTDGGFRKRHVMTRYVIGQEGIMNALLDEFPHLYTTPQTMHYLWERHSRQIEMLTRNYAELKKRYMTRGKDSSSDLDSSKYHKFVDEAYRRQKVLMEIMRDDLARYERINELKRHQNMETSVKAKQREERFKSAKIKRYLTEFGQEHRARMMKQATSEELVFKRLFTEALHLQKERMLEMKKYAREKSELMVRQQIDQIESIENAYKNKFAMLNERMQAEKSETAVRERAQQLALRDVKRSLKGKLEGDIRDVQEKMYRDRDFLHWRQMDAEIVKDKVLKAGYVNEAV